MITTPMTRRTLLGTALLTGLAACSSNDPLNSDGSGSGSADLIVGSANFTESEIIAEVYAQSLEEVGITVKRRMQIGARDVYVKALQDGSVDLVPEYSGNLLQFFQGASSSSDEKSVMAALRKAVPAGLSVGRTLGSSGCRFLVRYHRILTHPQGDFPHRSSHVRFPQSGRQPRTQRTTLRPEGVDEGIRRTILHSQVHRPIRFLGPAHR